MTAAQRRPCRSLLLALCLVALPAGAQQVLRYSGRVELVDLGEGLVVVDEMGTKGQHRRREVHIRTDTAIVSAGRERPWMRGGGSYLEVPVALPDVVAGDFVVVESVLTEGRAVALRITIIESGTRR